MALTPEATQQAVKANRYEDMGQFKAAEEAYLKLIEMIEPDEKAIIGAVYINLGKNSHKADRIDDAETYYKKAIEILEGLKGEAILQNAHCHFSLANLLLDEKNDPGAVRYSEEALKLYERYPLTSNEDLADAKMLNSLARLYIQKTLTEREYIETWNMMKMASFQTLTMPLVMNFMLNFLEVSARSKTHNYADRLSEIEAWADKKFVQQLTGMQRSREEKDLLSSPLMKNLLGLPDEEMPSPPRDEEDMAKILDQASSLYLMVDESTARRYLKQRLMPDELIDHTIAVFKETFKE